MSSSKYPRPPFLPEKLCHFGAQTVFGRPGMPAELAGIYVLLADNQSSFATGQIYGSSGGAGPL